MSSRGKYVLALLSVLITLSICVFYIWFNGGIKNTVRNWTPGPDYGGHSFKSYQDKISAELDAGFRDLSEDRDLIEYAESLHDFAGGG